MGLRERERGLFMVTTEGDDADAEREAAAKKTRRQKRGGGRGGSGGGGAARAPKRRAEVSQGVAKQPATASQGALGAAEESPAAAVDESAGEPAAAALRSRPGRKAKVNGDLPCDLGEGMVDMTGSSVDTSVHRYHRVRALSWYQNAQDWVIVQVKQGSGWSSTRYHVRPDCFDRCGAVSETPYTVNQKVVALWENGNFVRLRHHAPHHNVISRDITEIACGSRYTVPRHDNSCH